MSEKNGFDELRVKYKDVLSKAFATNNIDLLDSFSKNANETDRKAAMDQAFRDKLLELLIEEPDTLENYVCFCIESCRRQMVTPTMPVVLLGDIFDALTLNKCEKLFTYVENGVNIWREELFFVAWLNIVSEFNLENVTEFGGDNTSTLKDSLDEEMVIDDDKNKLAIDYNLYCRFWSLQDFFRNPNTCYNKLQWKTFVAHSGSVLSAFSSYKLEAVELQKSKLNRLKPVNANIEMQENKEQHYFAKFLTNQKLLELQLSDSNFRRCVLIQFLILFQYLTSTVKFKMESQELKSDQLDWVKETTSLIYKLLGETPPDGKRFADCVKSILKREEHWNSWKNDGCPEFMKPKPPVQVESTDEVRKAKKRRRPVGDIIKEYEGQEKFFMGNNDLTKLWNLCPDNLEACRTKERDFMPSLESYMLSGGAGGGPGGAGGGAGGAGAWGGGWGWRALRLLARRSPHFFVHTNNPIGKLPDYLDDMVKKISREVAANAASSNVNGDSSSGSDKAVKQEQVEEEMAEEQIETDIIKEEDTADMEQVPDSTHGEEDDKTSRSRVTMITPTQLDALATKMADWKKLAAKLGYKPDEIQFFETENATDVARAKNMLQLWFDDDEDASVENLLYIMEGLKMTEACDTLRSVK
ncbi:unnamed protein product, partial [Brenthis ino]